MCCCAPCAVGQVKEMVTTGERVALVHRRHDDVRPDLAPRGFVRRCETAHPQLRPCDVLHPTPFAGCGFLISMGVRTELRNKYKLPEKPCGDCLFHCCCGCCAITQDLKEARIRVVNAGGPEATEMAR